MDRGSRGQHDSRERRPYRNGSPPSNTELAERTARIEEQIDHVADVVDDLDEKLDGELDDVTETQETLKTRQERLWTGYRLARWAVGGGSVSAALFALV